MPQSTVHEHWRQPNGCQSLSKRLVPHPRNLMYVIGHWNCPVVNWALLFGCTGPSVTRHGATSSKHRNGEIKSRNQPTAGDLFEATTISCDHNVTICFLTQICRISYKEASWLSPRFCKLPLQKFVYSKNNFANCWNACRLGAKSMCNTVSLLLKQSCSSMPLAPMR